MTSRHSRKEDWSLAQAPRWVSVLLLVCLVLLAIFSAAGYVTAGSLQAPGYRTAATLYLGLLAFSLTGLLGILVWRVRHKNASQPVI
jgi:hypothetical protein